MNMKRRTTPTLRVCIDFDNSSITTIDFIFKQIRSEEAPIKVQKTYPTNVTYDSTNKIYMIPFTEAETALFESQKEFYMDTKITTNAGKIPATDIVQLFMRDTLFSSAVTEDEDD